MRVPSLTLGRDGRRNRADRPQLVAALPAGHHPRRLRFDGCIAPTLPARPRSVPNRSLAATYPSLGCYSAREPRAPWRVMTASAAATTLQRSPGRTSTRRTAHPPTGSQEPSLPEPHNPVITKEVQPMRAAPDRPPRYSFAYSAFVELSIATSSGALVHHSPGAGGFAPGRADGGEHHCHPTPRHPRSSCS